MGMNLISALNISTEDSFPEVLHAIHDVIGYIGIWDSQLPTISIHLTKDHKGFNYGFYKENDWETLKMEWITEVAKK
jgi:hypothetical protein